MAVTWGLIAIAATLGIWLPFSSEVLGIPPRLLFLAAQDSSGYVVSHGALWDSAHGPPFLTTFGFVIVYVLPAFAGLAAWVYLLRKVRWAS